MEIRVKVPKPLRHAVDVSDIPRLLDSCETVRDKLIILMLADTGLRLSELAGIRPDDVDSESHTLTVWGKHIGHDKDLRRTGEFRGCHQGLQANIDLRLGSESAPI